MSAKLAKLVKEARTNAGLTQQGLADLIPGLSASDIGKTERNEKEPTQEQIKAIAKATGVTQKSLLEAASAKTTGTAKTASKTGTAKTSTSKTSTSKTGTSKTSTSKTSTSKTTAAKKTGSTAKAASEDSMKLTAAEKKLVELYRSADADTKKAALKVLKGEESDMNDILSSILGGLLK